MALIGCGANPDVNLEKFVQVVSIVIWVNGRHAIYCGAQGSGMLAVLQCTIPDSALCKVVAAWI